LKNFLPAFGLYPYTQYYKIYLLMSEFQNSSEYNKKPPSFRMREIYLQQPNYQSGGRQREQRLM
jgi:hypothetical protein